MKKAFLTSWRGIAIFGKQNQFALAQGSSLTEGEVKILSEGGVIQHPKGKSLVKVFVSDEDGNLWSVIVHVIHLEALERDLRNVGYLAA